MKCFRELEALWPWDPLRDSQPPTLQNQRRRLCLLTRPRVAEEESRSPRHEEYGLFDVRDIDADGVVGLHVEDLVARVEVHSLRAGARQLLSHAREALALQVDRVEEGMADGLSTRALLERDLRAGQQVYVSRLGTRLCGALRQAGRHAPVGRRADGHQTGTSR